MPDPLLSPTDFRFTAEGELVVGVTNWPATPPDDHPDQAAGAAGPATRTSAATTGDDG
ncbi:hypothetical protein [Micromonospora sp. WMMD987]|jgi:hypothetical protein|uniref:hypothetical protein n=1 Tax=Micromonospora TaxID=1873 RepID=UPI00249C6BE8|nr:hypothetical protein [Micromonospora sp. WMMD987]WFE96519.1 hypothetical protein O7612_06375 [Micromonospora sp. WMMD987]